MAAFLEGSQLFARADPGLSALTKFSRLKFVSAPMAKTLCTGCMLLAVRLIEISTL